MKNHNKFFCSLFLFSLYLFSGTLSSQNYLRVVDPKVTWRQTTPNITEATISIRPRGLYIEYGYYLTYSMQQTAYNTIRDTFEIQHYFTLPQGSAFNDSWLWVENQIMKALLWDRWSATSVYEGIVKRRQDPSILYKNSATNYEYRIFPIVGNQTRRVKLNFYVPAKWSPSQLTAPIPLSMITTSSRIPNVNLIVYESNDWKIPSVDIAPNTVWETVIDSTFGTSKRTTLVNLNSSSVPNISYSSIERKPYYFSNSPTLGTTDEGHYQLAFLPKAFLNDENGRPKKILFLMDYEASNTAFSQQQMLNILKMNIRENLSPRDSFNIFYNRLTTKKVNSTWLQADSINIERAFATLSDPSVGLGNSSILTSLIAEGYGFVKSKGSGEVMIISSNDGYSAYTTVQSFYSDLTNQFDPLPVTHAFDFSSRSLVPYFWAQSSYYYGNELLYRVLTSNTRGNFVNLTSWNPIVSEMEKGVSDILQQLVPYAPIDLIIKPNVGLTYERYDLQTTNGYSVNQSVMQVGKYKGSFPFIVDITTTNAANQLVSGRLSLLPNPTAFTDSSNRQLHGANKIQALENAPVNNGLINRIIQESKAYRILSRYTAFIALEPNLQTPCDTCKDETGGVKTSVVDVKKDSVKITVYPNPFKDVATITIEKPVSAKVSNILIFNTLGQPVKVFNELDLKTNAEKLTLTWQDSSISAGTYIFNATIDGKRYVQKLVKIRE